MGANKTHAEMEGSDKVHFIKAILIIIGLGICIVGITGMIAVCLGLEGWGE